MKNIYLNWSGGKDSALALAYLTSDSRYQVKKLITTLDSKLKKNTLHGISMDLLEKQANAIGIDIQFFEYEEFKDSNSYLNLIEEITNVAKSDSIQTHAFGDIFLEDVIEFKKETYTKFGADCIFPLKLKSTRVLAENFIEFGFKAVVTSVDTHKMDTSFLGNEFDLDFINKLPEGVDPCGENGEFHTFVYAAPYFGNEIEFETQNTYKLLNRYQIINLEAK